MSGSTSKAAELGVDVGAHVARLQAEFLAEVPSARARLAQLRQGLGKAPGSVPSIWGDTIEILAQRLRGADDAPSRAETASHLALTMYALHQQGRTTQMHVAGVGVGTAIRRLMASGVVSEQAVRRRFVALATAREAPEAVIHLRGLVTQFRGRDIPLDYGQLARDVYGLMHPETANPVRLHWGRQLHVSWQPDAPELDRPDAAASRREDQSPIETETRP